MKVAGYLIPSDQEETKIGSYLFSFHAYLFWFAAYLIELGSYLIAFLLDRMKVGAINLTL